MRDDAGPEPDAAAQGAAARPFRLLLVGGTGLVGGHIIRTAPERARIVVSGRGATRPRNLPKEVDYVAWDAASIPPFEGRFDAVINVAGASVAGKRWTASYKREMRQSRVDVNHHLARWIKDHPVPPEVFVTASAVGYYGADPQRPCPETQPPGDDFLAQLCKDWEDAAAEAAANGTTRVVACRCGIVLDRRGGALAKMRGPFLLGLGGPIGSGQQPFPWISGPDAGRAYWHALFDDGYAGAVNVVAPHRIDNATFAKRYGQVLHRPAILPIPAVALRLIFGESASALTHGQDAVPERLEAHGFEWRHPEITEALVAAEEVA